MHHRASNCASSWDDKRQTFHKWSKYYWKVVPPLQKQKFIYVCVYIFEYAEWSSTFSHLVWDNNKGISDLLCFVMWTLNNMVSTGTLSGGPEETGSDLPKQSPTQATARTWIPDCWLKDKLLVVICPKCDSDYYNLNSTTAGTSVLVIVHFLGIFQIIFHSACVHFRRYLDFVLLLHK